MKLKVDKPLQVKIQEEILEIIRKKGLQGGDQIPTETELMKQLGTGRSTLREGLANLSHQGILYKIQGKGTFVRKVPVVVENGMDRLLSVTEQIKSVGSEPLMARCEVREFLPDQTLCNRLRIEKEETCVWIERLRLANDSLAAYCIDIMPVYLIPGAEKKDFEGSLFDLLAIHGTIVSHTESTLHPTLLTQRDLPELKHIGMFMLFEEIYYDTKGIPVCYSNDYYNAEIFDFKISRKRNL